MARPQNRPPGAIDQQAVQRGLHAGQLRHHPLPQRRVVAQLLRLDAANDLLRLADQLVELRVRSRRSTAGTVGRIR